METEVITLRIKESNRNIEKKRLSVRSKLLKLKGTVKGEELELIAADCDCSKSTIYSYLGGNVANVFIGDVISNTIQDYIMKQNQEKSQIKIPV